MNTPRQAHPELCRVFGRTREAAFGLYALVPSALISFALIPFALMTACSIGLSDRIQEIELGMSETQVIETLGEPDERRTVGEHRGLKWANDLIRVDPPNEVGYWVPAHYWVVLRRGRVVSHGHGSVREIETPRRLVLDPVDD